MNLYIRVFILLITSIFKSPIKNVLETTRLRLYVLPTDLDINMHMNNGRYPTVMDLGRLDFILRVGLADMMFKQKSVPVLSSIKMRFRLPLDLFQPYDLETRIVCWDEKWVYLEQRFVIVKGPKAGAVAAIGLIKGSFYSRKTRATVPTSEVLEMIGAELQSPEMPAHIRDWAAAEESLKAVTAAA